MEKEYTVDTIHEFFDDLDNKEKTLNPNISKMIVWSGYEKDRQRQEAELKIESLFKNAIYYHRAQIITDEIAIVEEFKRGQSMGFFTCVNKKRGYTRYPSFEEALLGAISIKYTGREDAAEWMIKLLK